jgi:hypothetical protein
LSDRATGTTVSPNQRLALRQICSAPERVAFEPEDYLIAFKLALVDAANQVGILPGPDRNDFLARLVSVYIEEFYRRPSVGDGGKSSGDQELIAGT